MSVKKIGSFLKRKKDSVEIKDSKEYKRITIKSKHQGIFLRDVCKGSLIGTKLQFKVEAGQFLLSKIDARLGAFGIVPDDLQDAIITGNFWTFEVDKSKANIEWFNLFTSSSNFYEICDKASSGTTHRKYLDEQSFLNFEIELPSLVEQNVFLQDYKQYKRSFDTLSKELGQQQSYLRLLRQSILQEAIRGRLTMQDANEEPAKELLKRIRTAKQKLIKEGKLKREKELLPIAEDEIPFELPKGWAWCRLGEVAFKITDGFHNTPARLEEGVPYVLATHIKSDGIDFENCSYVSQKDHQDLWIKAYPQKGEVLLVNIGAGCGTPAIIDVDFEFSFKNSAIIKQPKEINTNYLFNYLLSIQTKVYSEIIQGGAQPYLSLKMINNLLFPLPPLLEQQRIAAKVQQVQKLLSCLDAQVQQSQQYAQQLLQTAVKGAFEINKKDYAIRIG